ncbi:MAG: nucleoside-diphosphate sugar epimerase [Chlorobi bacterium OLB5]|nr:MAG: nucleoside-diphosphate sugar epimerase [Chlorobi bacterium OLB5]
MPKTFLITGATGFIGGYLVKKILERGDSYIALTTNPVSAAKKLKGYNKITDIDDYLQLKDEKIDTVINLAGSNLGAKRWTDSAKKEFYDSRIKTTGKLISLFEEMKVKPEVFISASGVDYYGNTGSREMTEEAPPAQGYLGKMTNDWEKEALKAEQYGIRTVVLRTGLVMAQDSEAIKKLLMPVKMFIGGPLGSGRQYVSWIHIDDLVGIYFFASENKNVKGIYNAAAPHPVTNAEFTKNAARLLGRPAYMMTPAFMIKAVFGEMSAVVLDGRKASANKIIDAGYKFKYGQNTDAWKDVLSRK